VWVYAGGGYAEAEGIVPLLKKHFAEVTFHRRTPAHRRPGPRPDIAVTTRGARAYAGNTGASFQREITENITQYWHVDGPADVIIVIDDSDCNPPDALLETFQATVTKSLSDIAVSAPPIVTGLAVPEIEVWLLGDWEMTFAKEYPRCEKSLQQELVRRGVRTSEPEAFNCRPDAQAYIKLSSDVLLPALEEICTIRFSKASDTPKLLLRIRPETVKTRCAYFRRFWVQLEKHLTPGNASFSTAIPFQTLQEKK
jgi:hypothetical protein